MAKRRTAQGIDFQRLMDVERLQAIAVSPDGTRVVLTCAIPNVADNSVRTTLKLLHLDTGAVVELTPGQAGGSAAAWSPDGSQLAFVRRRELLGAQVWVLPMAGGEARVVTSGEGGAACPLWAPDGRRIAFARDVVVSAHLKRNKAQAAEPASHAQVHGLAHPKSSAQVSDTLLFRHWDSWRDHRRSHVMIVDIGTGEMADATPGDWDSPPISLGSACDYAFHPDGSELAFVANPDEVVARSTNNSIFVQRLRGVRPVGKPKNISVSEACDSHPRYSADGNTIAYLAMQRPRFEADRQRIQLYDRKRKTTDKLLKRFDRSPSGFEWARSDDGLVFRAQHFGRNQLFRVSRLADRVFQLTDRDNVRAFAMGRELNELIVVRDNSARPAELYRVTGQNIAKPNLTAGHVADSPLREHSKLLTQFTTAAQVHQMRPAEDFWFEGADGDLVHGFLVKPADFDRRRNYPLMLLIHGGPQSAFCDEFHYRWSMQMFTSRGACVIAINPRGSTGYGQKFSDQIRGDWGGRCYRDLMRGVDYALKQYPFLDGKRMAAAGASFGGYMVNWIAGHSDRFKALVCHDGIFNTEMFAYTTEELWFPEHEYRGMPHKSRTAYLEQSPHLHAKKFKTPTLVIQGGLDYRCTPAEGVGMFTALQINGVPSRYLHFPDEGHWITTLANAQVWYTEILDWVTRYLE